MEGDTKERTRNGDMELGGVLAEIFQGVEHERIFLHLIEDNKRVPWFNMNMQE